MTFNYVLISKKVNSDDCLIIGLFSSKLDAIKKADQEIAEMYKKDGKINADFYILYVHRYFDEDSHFALVSKDKNNKLNYDPIPWSRLKIQGTNANLYIDELNYVKEMKLAKKAKVEKENKKLVQSALNDSHNLLPKARYDDKYCWCLVDLQQYKAWLEDDVEELDSAGDYAEYAETAFRDNQFDAMDSLLKLQGEYAILLGKTRFYTNSNAVLKRDKLERVYPFNSENTLYALTDKGIEQLKNDLCKLDIMLEPLVHWCASLKGKLPKQTDDKESVAEINQALPNFRIVKEADKPQTVIEAIRDIDLGYTDFLIK